jgi:serine/threonine-protein kinase
MGATKVKKIGKYEVLDVLGKGGMGIVYKARDNEIGRLVAIKMITSVFAEDTDFLTRFRREAQSTGQLHHPNIVIVHDLGDHEGSPFLVMEFLEGESIESILRSQRSVSLINKLDYAIQVCNGLQYAHQRSPAVVHRDIKPPNLIVLLDGTVKIVDFGIAHVENEQLTQRGQFLGSLQYMSPEQVNCNPIDARTDVYSTGVVLFQLLTNALPFQGKDTGTTLLKIINEPPPSLRNYLDAYPPEFDDILFRVLAKQPDDRYQTADDLAYDLGRVQERLKRESVVQHIGIAEEFIRRSELGKASEEVQEILKIDRQSARGRELQREIQSLKAKQQRSEQARQIFVQAEQAATDRNFAKALAYLDEASGLDPGNSDFDSLRRLVEADKARQEALRESVKRAESAYYAGDYTQAERVIDEAAALDESDPEVKALRLQIVRDREERDRQNQMRGYLDEAQRLIASRNFTAAIEILQKAESFEPNVTAVRELMSIATLGRNQERHRKAVEKLAADIEDALNQENFVDACAKAQQALEQFPDERGLLKLKALAEKQREAAEKRQYIEAQNSAARKLLEGGQTEAALTIIEAACSRFPNEPSLVSSLNAIRQTLELERIEAHKNTFLQNARASIRNKQFDEAVSILESYPADHYAPEIADLLQFARDEATAAKKQQRIQAAVDQAQTLMAADQYEKAIEFLTTLPHEDIEEELQVLLAEARRYVEEFQQRTKDVREALARLTKSDRFAEAVRYIEAQPTKVRETAEIRQALEMVRTAQARSAAIHEAVERIRALINRQEFDAATAEVERSRAQYADSPELSLIAGELDARKREVAFATVKKAVSDARTLLLAHSYLTALELLDGVEPLLELVPEDLQTSSRSVRASANHGLEIQKLQELRQTQAEAAEREEAVEAVVEDATDAPGTIAKRFRRSDLNNLILTGDSPDKAKPADVAESRNRGAYVPEPVKPERRLEPTATQLSTATSYEPTSLEGPRDVEPKPWTSQAPPTPQLPVVSPEDLVVASTIVEERAAEPEAPPAPVEIQPEAPKVVKDPTPPLAESISAIIAPAILEPSEPVVQVDPVRADSMPVSQPEFPITQTPPDFPPAPSPAPPTWRKEVSPPVIVPPRPPVPTPLPPIPSPRFPRTAYLVAALVVIAVIVVGLKYLLPSQTTVRINSVPAGATVAVGGKSCVTPDCELQLKPGDYEVTAALVGYANDTHSLTVEGKSPPPPVELTLKPLETAIYVNTNFSAGNVSLDGKTQASLTNGQLILPSVAPGNHEIAITSADGAAKLRFDTQVAQIPQSSGTPLLKDVSALFVASLAGSARAFCNCDRPTDLQVDGKPHGTLSSNSVDIGNLGEGSRELRLGQGQDSRSHIVKLEAGPSLSIFLNSDRNVGTLVVQAGIEGADVFVDGNQVGRTENNGQWRSILPVKDVSVRVRKTGYADVPALTAQIRKGNETGLSFSLEPLKPKATLSIVEAVRNTSVSVDGKPVGQVGPSGRLSVDIDPGRHVIELTAEGYKNSKSPHDFRNGENFQLHGELIPVLSPPGSTANGPDRAQAKPLAGEAAVPKPPVIDTGASKPPAVTTSQPITRQPEKPDANADADEWAQLKTSDDIKKLNAYIDKYKTGPYVDQAKGRLQQLQSASDRTAILTVLKSYSSAYQNKSVAEIRAIWPGLSTGDQGKLNASFGIARAIQMDLKPTSDPAISGDSATVACNQKIQVTLPSGDKPIQSGNITIKLSRKDGKWLIDSIR